MVVVREEQASANHTSEFLAAELKSERMYSRAALGTSGNRGGPQESVGTHAEGSVLSRHIQELVQRFEEFSLEVHAKFEGIRLDLERTREKRRELAQSLGGFQGDLQELAETVDSLRGGAHPCGSWSRQWPAGCELHSCTGKPRCSWELVRE